MKVHVDAAGVLLEDERGELLVLRRQEGVAEGRRLGLPAGGIEAGETPAEAAVREVREETGIRFSSADLTFVRSYDWHEDRRQVTFAVFKAQVRREDQRVTLDPRESTAFHWLSPVDLAERDDLMAGLYPILHDEYGTKLPDR